MHQEPIKFMKGRLTKDVMVLEFIDGDGTAVCIGELLIVW